MRKFQKKIPVNTLNNQVLLKSEILKPFDFTVYERCFVDAL